ncbi:MAG: YceD family protein [Desulfonatronovibrio sp.]
MQEQWLHISDIPVQGREFYFEGDQDWISLCSEIGLEYEVSKDTSALLGVFPQKHGIFFKGFIKGQITAPCSRCLEPARTDIDHKFEIFEDFEETEREPLGTGILKFENGHWMVNVRQVIREQLVLAMPDKVLCSEKCLGLCPECGANINSGLCRCELEPGDPRLAKLRQIKIKTH